jgi:preprotein translocase subunit SecA
LFRSTTNLMAFEQFLSALPVGLNLPGIGGPLSASPAPRPVPRREQMAGDREVADQNGNNDLELVIPAVRQKTMTVGRNEPCPCGSGKKYKNCHGRVA